LVSEKRLFIAEPLDLVGQGGAAGGVDAEDASRHHGDQEGEGLLGVRAGITDFEIEMLQSDTRILRF
jgi:hypothetical protein